MDVSDCDPNFKVRVLGEGEDMLFDCLADRSLVKSVGDFPFHFHADLTNVGNRLIGGRNDH